MTTEEAVEQGLLEHINTTDEWSEFYANPEAEAGVVSDEEREVLKEECGWDWL